MPQNAEKFRRPKLSELGRDLLYLTAWQRVRAIGWPFLAFFAYWAFAWSEHWILAALSLVVLSFVTYGSTSHDLVHGTLGLKRSANDLLLFAVELIALRSGHAYQLAHLNHHARYPRSDDIEARAARMSLVGALLEGIVFQARIYLWAVRTPRGRNPWIVTEGILVVALILGAVAAVPWTVAPGIYAGLMIAGSWTIPFVTSYLPHKPDEPNVWRQTRVFRGLLVRIVAFDHLYHWEHHLFPAVPHQNWPRLARRLDPWLAAAGIEPVRLGR